jgi:hypothetical protein
MRAARQVGQHSLRPGERALGIDHPLALAQLIRYDRAWTVSSSHTTAAAASAARCAAATSTGNSTALAAGRGGR